MHIPTKHRDGYRDSCRNAWLEGRGGERCLNSNLDQGADEVDLKLVSATKVEEFVANVTKALDAWYI